MNLSPKASALLTAALVLGTAGSYFGYVALLERSAQRFLAPKIPAIIEQHSVEPYVTLSNKPLGPHIPQTLLELVNRQFVALSALGSVISFQPPAVEISTGYEFPPQFHPKAHFRQEVVFARGSVIVEGDMAREQPWKITSISAQPQGTAKQIIDNRNLADYFYHSPLAGLPVDTPNHLITNYLAHDIYIQRQGSGMPMMLDGAFHYTLDHDEHLPDGRSVAFTLGNAISSSFGDEAWDKAYADLQRWRAKGPTSPGAAVTEAIYWVDYGWKARGAAYASTITAEGAQLFHERLLRAKAALDDSKSYASVNPVWYSTYLKIAVGLGDSDLFRQAFTEGQRRFPTYDGLYLTSVWAMQPKWYGSYEVEDKLINEAAAARGPEGNSFYAILYWYLDDIADPDFNLFRNSKANWPRMKQGLEDLRHQYPDSKLLLNNYAALACAAKDKATFHLLSAQIGPSAKPSDWRGGQIYLDCQQILK